MKVLPYVCLWGGGGGGVWVVVCSFLYRIRNGLTPLAWPIDIGGRHSGLPFITTFRGSLGPPHHAHRGSFWYYKGPHCFPWNKHLHIYVYVSLSPSILQTTQVCHLKMHHFNKKKHGKLDQTCFIYRQILRHLPNIAYRAWSKNCRAGLYSSLAWW